MGFTRRAGATRFTHACLGDLVREFPEAVPQLLLPPPLPMALLAADDAPSSSTAGSTASGTAASPGGTTALVFGREEGGLTEQELRLVSHACAIPSGRLQPSLNLSHAVAVILAEVGARNAQRFNVMSPDILLNWLHAPFDCDQCFNRRAEPGSFSQDSHRGTGMLCHESVAGAASVTPGRQSTSLQAAIDKPDTGSTYATVSEVEFLFQKIAAIAEASGVRSVPATAFLHSCCLPAHVCIPQMTVLMLTLSLTPALS